MKYILTFLQTKKPFREGLSIQCEKCDDINAYRFNDFTGKSKFIDMPFEFEGIIYKIREEPQTD